MLSSGSDQMFRSSSCISVREICKPPSPPLLSLSYPLYPSPIFPPSLFTYRRLVKKASKDGLQGQAPRCPCQLHRFINKHTLTLSDSHTLTLSLTLSRADARTHAPNARTYACATTQHSRNATQRNATQRNSDIPIVRSYTLSVLFRAFSK